MKLRVLHLITGLTRGGAESMLVRLLGAMDREAFDPRVLCLGAEAPLAAELREQGVPTLCLGLGWGAPGLWRLPGFCLRGAPWQPHIIQGWMYHGNLAAYLAARFIPGQAPLLWNIRVGIDTMATYRPMTRALIHLGARLSAAADVVLYNAHSARRQHEAIGYREDRSRWIPNGFALDRFHPDPSARAQVRKELGLEPEARLIGQFARFHPEKNHRMFLDALRRLPPEVHGVFAGQGVHQGQPELNSALRDPALAGRVHLLGERTDLPRLTAALDIAVSPSWNEGFSNALGEALACGVPCVATHVGDSAVLVGAAGRIIPAGDTAALAEAVHSLLSLSAEQRIQLGELGRVKMETEFSIRSVALQYQSLYQSLVR